MEVPFQISNLVKISFFQYITDCRTQKERKKYQFFSEKNALV